MGLVAHVVVYCNESVKLQSDATLRRVSEGLEGESTKVLVMRRPMPYTVVTVTWVEEDTG